MGTNSEFRTDINRVMFAIAAGKSDAIWHLHALAEPALAAMVRTEAARVGVSLGRDDTFNLTLDAAMELGRMARSWSPVGALPWVWARKAILAIVQRELGTFTRELDDEVLEREEPPARVAMEEPVAALRALAQRHAGARELQDRLEQLVSPRDADIWLRFQVERDGGNRSPAVTVAVDHSMRADAVRKVVQRVTERLSVAAGLAESSAEASNATVAA